jgi:hypothetical protein
MTRRSNLKAEIIRWQMFDRPHLSHRQNASAVAKPPCFVSSLTKAATTYSPTGAKVVAGRRPVPKRSALRELTIIGEEAMLRAQEEGRILLSGYSNEVVRSYAASGLLMAALDELQTGVARDSAADTLREALIALGGMPS